MRLIVCGDSFNVEDSRYPGIHWIDHLRRIRPDIDIVNLSERGDSNALIALQVLQSIKLNADFIVVSFSGFDRYEVDREVHNHNLLTVNDIHDIKKIKHEWFQSTNTCSQSTTEDPRFKIYQKWITRCQSGFMNEFRNRLIIACCLYTLRSCGIGFCYSPGNLDPWLRQLGVDANGNEIFLTLESLQAHDPLSEFDVYKLSSNVWDYREPHGPANFHIMDADWQEQHCKNIIDHINSWHANGQTQHTK